MTISYLVLFGLCFIIVALVLSKAKRINDKTFNSAVEAAAFNVTERERQREDFNKKLADLFDENERLKAIIKAHGIKVETV